MLTISSLNKLQGLLVVALLGSPLCAVAATFTNITMVYPPGYRLVSNPLLSTNNDVSNLFQNPPAYLTLFKQNVFRSGYDISTYDPDLSGWTAPMSLVPGEGAFLYNPAGQNYTNTFYGEIQFCSTNAIPSGYSIRSQGCPIRKLTNYPNGPTDSFFLWNQGSYSLYAFDPDAGGWVPSEPQLIPGEAFWIFNGGPAKAWVVCIESL